jgi:adenylate cyclase
LTDTDPDPDPDPTQPGEQGEPTSADVLERVILGETPSLTVGDLRSDAGNEIRDAARLLWRAMGFPDPGDEAAFTEADRHAMELVASLVESEALDLETAVKLTRAIGHTMGRLADWQVSTVSEYVEGLEETGRGSGSRLRTGLGVLREIEPPFEEVMLHAWRRHLAAAVSRVEALGAQDSDLHTVTVTVGFADLVSFTQISHGLAEDHLADLVEGFETACADLVTGRGGRVIKTLGDSVLFLADQPVQGVDIACDIVEQIGGAPAMPDVHLGLATGPVVMRLGDVFGSPVNLASRLTGVARRNRVICDQNTAEILKSVGGYALRPLTERSLRGFGTLQPVAVRRL